MNLNQPPPQTVSELAENVKDVRTLLELALNALSTVKKDVEQVEEVVGTLLYEIEKDREKRKQRGCSG